MKLIHKTLIISTLSFNLFAQSGEEKHLKNIRQLTFGGNNAEAYFSRNDKFISYQSDNTQWGLQ
jgi:TolB protein